LTHVTAAVVVPGCLALCWWQVDRALSGNTLSWAYVFEWPIFAGYAVFMWWKLIHEPPPPAGPSDTNGAATTALPGPASDQDPGPPKAEVEAEEDEDLASYNRYLAALHDSGKRKHW
jgi:hypothetical protein